MRARWTRENDEFTRLLAEYRAAVDAAKPVIACGKLREGGCNHAWASTHVCQRAHGHAPPYPVATTLAPSLTHTCRCGEALVIAGPRQARRPEDVSRQARLASLDRRPEPRMPVPCPNVLPTGKRCGQVAFVEADTEGNRLPPGHRRCWGCRHVWSTVARPAAVGGGGR